MGKAIVLGPIIIFFAIFAFFVFLFFSFIVKGIKKQKASEWKGELIDKTHAEVDDDDSPYTKDYYTLIFKTTEGKKIKVGVTENIYNEYQIGDQAEKIPGELRPRKVS